MNPAKNDPKLDAAIRILEQSTPYFDVWALAGPQSAKARAALMSILVGRKVPQAQAGVNAIRAEFWTRANVTGDHIAGREKNFEAFCRAVVAAPFGSK